MPARCGMTLTYLATRIELGDESADNRRSEAERDGTIARSTRWFGPDTDTSKRRAADSFDDRATDDRFSA